MKKLFALINPEGKTKEQITDELWQAYQKYLEMEKKVATDAENELIVDETEKEEGNAFIIPGLPKPKPDDKK